MKIRNLFYMFLCLFVFAFNAYARTLSVGTLANDPPFSFASKLGQNELIGQINKALVDMEKDGTYLNIYREYF